MTVSTKPFIEALQVADEDGVVTAQALEAPAVVSREMPAPDSVMMRAGLVVPVSAPVMAVFGLNVKWAVVAVPFASEDMVISSDTAAPSPLTVASNAANHSQYNTMRFACCILAIQRSADFLRALELSISMSKSLDLGSGGFGTPIMHIAHRMRLQRLEHSASQTLRLRCVVLGGMRCDSRMCHLECMARMCHLDTSSVWRARARARGRRRAVHALLSPPTARTAALHATCD